MELGRYVQWDRGLGGGLGTRHWEGLSLNQKEPQDWT